LVVIAIIAVLSLAITGRTVRPRSGAAHPVHKNLKQFGLALHNYID
jgi:glycerol dehydrogenase-like iron-containing ADH family enzyme